MSEDQIRFSEWLRQHAGATTTVPESLRRWIRSHPKLGYDLLFRSSTQALQDLASNPKRLGAQLGMLGVLHTWSRTLIFHPHIHFLIPGGGLSEDQRRWVACKGNYLLHERAVALRVRTLFKRQLEAQASDELRNIPAKTWKQSWIVHCKAVGSGEPALKYLSHYVFKTATANRLVRTTSQGQVVWPYRESRTGLNKAITLWPNDLISRFVQHVLPAGYHRVRWFGWLHPASRAKLNRVRALLRQPPLLTQEEQQRWLATQEVEDPVSELPETQLKATQRSQMPFCARCQLPMEWVRRFDRGTLATSFDLLSRPPPCATTHE